jgi:hypothetical protein
MRRALGLPGAGSAPPFTLNGLLSPTDYFSHVDFVNSEYRERNSAYLSGRLLALTDPGPATLSNSVGKYVRNRAGLIVPVAANAFSESYTESNTALGQLIEPSRTNIHLNSNNPSWTSQSNVTVNVVAAVTPISGLTTAVRVTATGANGYAIAFFTSANVQKTSSFWVRRISGSGTVNAFNANGIASNNITALIADGLWHRCETTVVASGGVAYAGVNVTTSGDIVEVVGAQIDDGAFATSYIPTTGSAVTVPVDNVALAFLENPVENYTVIVEFVFPPISADYKVLSAGRKSGGGYCGIETYFNPSDDMPLVLLRHQSGAILATLVGGIDCVPGTVYKLGITASNVSNKLEAAMTGGTLQSVTPTAYVAADMPLVGHDIGNRSNTLHFGGGIRSHTVIQRALTSADLLKAVAA